MDMQHRGTELQIKKDLKKNYEDRNGIKGDIKTDGGTKRNFCVKNKRNKLPL